MTKGVRLEVLGEAALGFRFVPPAEVTITAPPPPPPPTPTPPPAASIAPVSDVLALPSFCSPPPVPAIGGDDRSPAPKDSTGEGSSEPAGEGADVPCGSAPTIDAEEPVAWILLPEAFDLDLALPPPVIAVMLFIGMVIRK